MYQNELRITEEAKYKQLQALLNEKDWKHLLHRKDEWIDMEMYETEEEMIESNLEIRISLKGFDKLYNKLFVNILYIFHQPEYYISLRKNQFFDDFTDFYNFVDGHIYELASYPEYVFTDDIINKHNIDISQIYRGPFINYNVHNITTAEKIKNFYDTDWENSKDLRQSIIKCCHDVTNFNTLQSIEQKYADLGLMHVHDAVHYALVQEPEKVLKILETDKRHLRYEFNNYVLIYYRDGKLYDQYADPIFYNLFPKTYLNITPETPMTVERHALGYDRTRHLFYSYCSYKFGEEHTVTFNKFFTTIEELAAECDNDFSNGNFTFCKDNIDWSKYKTDGAQMLYEEITRHFRIIKNDDSGFKCDILFMSNGQEVTRYSEGFDTTLDLMYFLQFDDKKTQEVLNTLQSEDTIILTI